jgi:transcriptional regulator GlxA family with amidase domain
MGPVAAVIDQGALTFDLAIPCEVFGVDRSDIVTSWYEFMVVAAGESPVRMQTGFLLDTPYRLDELERAATIVVPGWSDPEERPSPELCEALRAAHARGARIVSLCTGAFVLADAGLLAGRRATTHWLYVDRLQARHPDVDLDPTVLYVVDGNVMTSAGTAAGVDLCLHLVRLDYGMDVAVAGRVAAARAPAAGAEAARVDGVPARRRRPARGLQLRDDDARPVRAAAANLAAGLSPRPSEAPRPADRSRAVVGRKASAESAKLSA